VKTIMAITLAFVCSTPDPLVEDHRLLEITKQFPDSATAKAKLAWYRTEQIEHGCEFLPTATHLQTLEPLFNWPYIGKFTYFDKNYETYNEKGDVISMGETLEGYGEVVDFGYNLPEIPIRSPSQKQLEIRRRIEEYKENRGR
jgi:hypothetical protein